MHAHELAEAVSDLAFRADEDFTELTGEATSQTPVYVLGPDGERRRVVEACRQEFEVTLLTAEVAESKREIDLLRQFYAAYQALEEAQAHQECARAYAAITHLDAEIQMLYRQLD